ncbi:complement C1q-like protein 3 [Mytilus trossulus]|uniref:complement C1q-like protein 3 n=1 Tax=Mytilus trossulus TaxID=6551 RepID=UPI0030060231
MMNFQMFVFSTCLLLTVMLAKEMEAGGCIERPAFTAILKRTLTLSKGNTIKFDTVILNQGRGYSPRTGIFTATKTGIYQISATVMSKGGAALNVYISKNGVYLMSLYGPMINGGTQTANPVLHLEEGDTVSVRSHGSHIVYGGSYTYFSAVYI